MPGGAFYVFPKVPWGTAEQFVHQAIAQGLLIIPGNIFSRRDTHFRISYAAPDATIDRGIEVLRKLRGRVRKPIALELSLGPRPSSAGECCPIFSGKSKRAGGPTSSPNP